jgi:hypothetical protein
MFLSDWSDPPEGHPEQHAYTFVIRIPSTSLTSVYIFSVCCYSRYLSRWERLTAIVQGSDSNSGSTGWRNSPLLSRGRTRTLAPRGGGTHRYCPGVGLELWLHGVEELTAIVQGSDSNSGSTGWRNSTPPKTSTPRMRAVFIRMHCSRRIPADGTVIGQIRIMFICLTHEMSATTEKEYVAIIPNLLYSTSVRKNGSVSIQVSALPL